MGILYKIQRIKHNKNFLLVKLKTEDLEGNISEDLSDPRAHINRI
jgi:hypothetical protein